MNEELIVNFTKELKKHIEGEINIDSAARTLYRTDASIYQIEPLGVVFPKHQDEVNAIVELAASYKVPILPRGSGSSLAGQAVGAAMIIDFSRHLNRILSFNPEARTAMVEPGVVLDTFNLAAAPFSLKFGPDPASSDRATFGGMIGNNSTGAHSIQYGMTADNILSLDVLLSDGGPVSLGEISLSSAAQRAEQHSIEGQLYETSLDIRQIYADEIKSRWPLTWRRSSGYSLNYLLPWSAAQPPQWGQEPYPPHRQDHINLAPLMVGSEGTLAVFRQAVVKLVPTPKNTILGVLSFQSVAEACDFTPEILRRKPTAIELIPRALIQRARSVPAYANLLWFVREDPAALLIVEFSGSNPEYLMEQVRKLDTNVIIADTPRKQEQIWKIRKVGLGLLMSHPGDMKPLPFVEDVAVPVENLGEFVREFETIMSNHGTSGKFYAHASAGCLHVRPLINLKSKEGQAALHGITAAVVELTIRLGGALSGEHGDGLARSVWLEKVYGPKLVNAFTQLKHAADPENILNPGKIVHPPPMRDNLRYTPDYRAKVWQPILDFTGQSGLAGAIEMCNGAGVCRKVNGVMCPSFQATQDEKHSTRGRANLLRAMISGQHTDDKPAEQDVFESLELCLECKGCKAECPSAVDMAKLKYEFLHHYYSHHRRPLRDYIFSHINTFARLGLVVAPFANALLRSRIIRRAAQTYLGISSERELPALIRRKSTHRLNKQPTAESVIFLPDVFSQYFYPEILQCAYEALQLAGCLIYELPLTGAGRTFISKGFLKQARNHAKNVMQEIERIDPQRKMPVIGIEPSEIYSLRDEYLDFFPSDEQVKRLTERTFMLEEFLVRPRNGELPRWEAIQKNGELIGDGTAVSVHGHCYQKAQPPSVDGYPNGVEATLKLLRISGYDPHLIESGCCGMAGSFGYEADHYNLSMQIGEMHLFPAVRALDDDVLVVAPGVSCRVQIEAGAGETALHPAQLLVSKR